MFPEFVAASEGLLLFPVAIVASWLVRQTLRLLTRRAVRRAQRAKRGTWRMRLDRLSDDGHAAARRRQRADAVARLFGHVTTIAIFGIAAVIGLDRVGVDPVVAISSAGFIGVAIAISAQDLVKDFLAGVRALLEDRYAVGDRITVIVGGDPVIGTVDLVGAASVRLHTPDGATWHAGHHTLDAVTNHSQLPTVTAISVPADEWADIDEAHATARLNESANDHGLTGVVFVREVEAEVARHPEDAATEQTATASTVFAEPDAQDDETVTVTVTTNRPLSEPQADLVRDRLLGR